MHLVYSLTMHCNTGQSVPTYTHSVVYGDNSLSLSVLCHAPLHTAQLCMLLCNRIPCLVMGHSQPCREGPVAAMQGGRHGKHSSGSAT